MTGTLNLSGCTLITGDLADLQGKLTGDLVLNACALITGDLADLQGKLTSSLHIGLCALITGDLADLQGKLTIQLYLYGNIRITGDLANLQGKLTTSLFIQGCNLINGVYTPSIAANTPTTFNVAGTGMSASDVDSTLIACDTTPKAGVTFTGTGLSRTSASNVAYTSLDIDHTWTFVGLA